MLRLQLLVIITVALLIQSLELASATAISHGIGQRPSSKVDKLEESSNSSSADESEMDLVCQPKRPLIEPLIAAGLVTNSSRLPAKLQQKINKQHLNNVKSLNVICTPIPGTQALKEYWCKTKQVDPDDAESDAAWEYDTGDFSS